jgi:hypothetical protein
MAAIAHQFPAVDDDVDDADDADDDEDGNVVDSFCVLNECMG